MTDAGDRARIASADTPPRRTFVAAFAALLLRPAVRPLAFAAPAALAACGFQLRSSIGLPFATLHASFPPASAATGADFRRLLRAAGKTSLVDRPEDAEARLVVLSELREKEIVSFSSTGRPREYQLRLKFAFHLLDAGGNELIPYTTLLLRRDITTTDTQLASKEQEEAILYRDMQADLVQMLLRRLAAAKPPTSRRTD